MIKYRIHDLVSIWVRKGAIGIMLCRHSEQVCTVEFCFASDSTVCIDLYVYCGAYNAQ